MEYKSVSNEDAHDLESQGSQGKIEVTVVFSLQKTWEDRRALFKYLKSCHIE